MGGMGIPARRDLPVCMKMELAVGECICPGDFAELAFGEIQGGTNVNILNSSLEQIVGLVLACGLGSSLSGCLPEVGELCSNLF